MQSNSDDVLNPFPLHLTVDATNFSDPGFGDARLYFSHIDGNVMYCLGSPGLGLALCFILFIPALPQSGSTFSTSLVVDTASSIST